jgi:hypothetical protein
MADHPIKTEPASGGWASAPVESMPIEARPIEAMGGDYDATGVDRSQIRAMLRLTPLERLQRLQGYAESILELRAELEAGQRR